MKAKPNQKLLRKLGHPHKELRVCYEAGPCGFVLARRLKQLGIACDVVAPSLTPKGSGDKIKTDRRDARMLARLHRAGELSAFVWEVVRVTMPLPAGANPYMRKDRTQTKPDAKASKTGRTYTLRKP